MTSADRDGSQGLRRVSVVAPTARRGDPWRTPAPQTVIWRYLSVWKFERLIAERALYFRRAALLADVLEGTAPPTNRAARPFIRARRPDLASFIDPLDAFEAQARRETYVSCWFSGPNEDAGMWAAYAEGGRGVAVQTTVGRLGEAIIPDPARGVVLVGVVYLDRERERFVELGNTLYWFIHKDRRYAHEREVRALTIHHAPESQPDGLSHPIDLDALVEHVVIGPRASGEVVTRVHDFASEHGFASRVRLSALELA